MNSEEYCRLCLKCDVWNSPLSIFVNSFSLPLKIRNLLGIELQRNDSLPQVICHLCLAKISFFDDFLKQIKSSANLLNSLIASRNNDQPYVSDCNKESQENTRISCVASLATVTSLVDAAHVKTSVASVDSSNVVRKVMPSGSNSRKELKKCHRCRFSTKNEDHYNNHISKNFDCPNCNASFCTERGVKRHQMVHKKKCMGKHEVRTRSVVDATDRGKLNADDHSDNSNSIYQWCKLCDKIFLSVEDFIMHNQEFHSTEENLSASENPVKVKNENKRKCCITETPDEINSTCESPDSVSSSKSSKKPKTKHNRLVKCEVVEHKKNNPGSSDAFKCWKCKGEYKNKEELFVHICLATSDKANSEEQSGASDSENSVVGKIKKKSTRTLTSESESESESESAFSNKIKSGAGNPVSKQNLLLGGSKNLIVLEDDSEDESDNPGRLDVKSSCLKLSQTDLDDKVTSCNTNCETITELVKGKTVIDIMADRIITGDNTCHSKNSLLKMCNECGDGFRSMKELFFHKQSHKISLINH